jgi:hypothetical protein
MQRADLAKAFTDFKNEHMTIDNPFRSINQDTSAKIEQDCDIERADITNLESTQKSV